MSVLSLNIQSINAKFDEFKIALDQLNNKQPINIICIQETWVDSTTDTCVFEIMKLKEITTDWENLFIKIKQKSNSAKNFIIGNIYRAPKELAQDIDLLKIHQKNQYSTFF